MLRSPQDRSCVDKPFFDRGAYGRHESVSNYGERRSLVHKPRMSAGSIYVSLEAQCPVTLFEAIERSALDMNGSLVEAPELSLIVLVSI